MNKTKISVLMSIFNGEPYLGESIESILNQTYNNFEFIITDDGSKDNTWEILCDFAQHDGRIKLLQNKLNIGVVRSLNRGLELAKGDFIARQDADDVSLPQRLEKQINFLDINPEIGLVGIVPQLIDIDRTPLEINPFTSTQNMEIQQELLDHMCLCGPTIVIRRQCFEAAGFYFSEGLDASEDFDLCLRVAEITQMASLRESLYLYRQHPNSASKTREQQQVFNKAVALERTIYRRFGPTPVPEKFANVARDYLRSAVIGVARNDLSAARKSLDHTMMLYPPILENEELLESLIRAYIPLQSTEAGLIYVESVFKDLLPHTHHLSWLKNRLTSSLHMSEVFKGVNQNQFWHVRPHLWPSIRNNPKWLFNRGVISILLKSLVKHNTAKTR